MLSYLGKIAKPPVVQSNYSTPYLRGGLQIKHNLGHPRLSLSNSMQTNVYVATYCIRHKKMAWHSNGSHAFVGNILKKGFEQRKGHRIILE